MVERKSPPVTPVKMKFTFYGKPKKDCPHCKGTGIWEDVKTGESKHCDCNEKEIKIGYPPKEVEEE